MPKGEEPLGLSKHLIDGRGAGSRTTLRLGAFLAELQVCLCPGHKEDRLSCYRQTGTKAIAGGVVLVLPGDSRL